MPPGQSPAPERAPAPSRWTGRWRLALLVTVVAVVASHLAALGSAPPGLYQDEASIGYDAWAVAHGGHDQHGTLLPLFFRSFDDYKSPLYHYLLAPLTLFLPLSSATIRLPAALCSIATCGVVGLTARRLDGGPAGVVLSVATAAWTPWLFVMGRLGFEVITLVLCLTLAMLCLAHAERGDGVRWFVGTGIALGLAVVAYPSGRLYAGLLAATVVAAHLLLRGGRHVRGWWWALAGPAAMYTVVAVWGLLHPGALTARLTQTSIAYDGAGPLTLVGRFAASYLRHVDPVFLLVSGDANRRHAVGVGGMLLVATAPALVVGAVRWARRWRQDAFAGIALTGLVLAPVPASLTQEGVPHALRAAPMLALLLVAACEGWPAVLAWLRPRRALAATLAVLGVAQAGAVLVDYFGPYPASVERAFDAGEDAAIARGHTAAGSHTLYLDAGFGQPYVHALVTLRPTPASDLDATLASLHVRTIAASDLAGAALPCDVAVLTPEHAPPPGWTVIDTEVGPASGGDTQVLARVAQNCRSGGQG